MSWEDRDYSRDNDPNRIFGRPGGDWQGVRPSLDNPMSWSLLLGRIAGISIRIHIIFLVFIVIELLKAAWAHPGQGAQTSMTFWLTVIEMACLFGIVLAHEFGHSLACRWTGGEANEILMWPLGGLAFCLPRNHWRAHFITAIGGPLVNVAICLVVGLILGLLTGQWLEVALPNPLHPFEGLYLDSVSRSLAHQTLYILNVLSLILLIFNLLPIFPLDGGRIVQTLLWPRMGYANSMRFGVRTGYIGAILLGIFGMVVSNYMLVGIALFGGITCYITHKQLSFTEEFLGYEDDKYAIGRDDQSDEDAEPVISARARKRAEKDARRQEQETAEIDRILQKIAENGIESLSGKEKKMLKKDTERRRKEN